MMYNSKSIVFFLLKAPDLSVDIFANPPSSTDELVHFNLMDDSPLFAGIYDYCRTYTSGTLGSAKDIISGEADVRNDRINILKK